MLSSLPALAKSEHGGPCVSSIGPLSRIMVKKELAKAWETVAVLTLCVASAKNGQAATSPVGVTWAKPRPAETQPPKNSSSSGD
jgi:hypothetical protein